MVQQNRRTKQLIPYLSKACATSRSPWAVVLFLSQTTVLQGEGHGEPCPSSRSPEVGARPLGARKSEPKTDPGTRKPRNGVKRSGALSIRTLNLDFAMSCKVRGCREGAKGGGDAVSHHPAGRGRRPAAELPWLGEHSLSGTLPLWAQCGQKMALEGQVPEHRVRTVTELLSCLSPVHHPPAAGRAGESPPRTLLQEQPRGTPAVTRSHDKPPRMGPASQPGPPGTRWKEHPQGVVNRLLPELRVDLQRLG